MDEAVDSGDRPSVVDVIEAGIIVHLRGSTQSYRPRAVASEEELGAWGEVSVERSTAPHPVAALHAKGLSHHRLGLQPGHPYYGVRPTPSFPVATCMCKDLRVEEFQAETVFN